MSAKNGVHSNVITTLETIDPTIASKYLEENLEENRQVRAAWVRQLASCITRGEWRVTHQGIAFDENGKLVDGQHRLMAICQAGKAVKLHVTRGLDPKVYRFLDCGQKRTPADRLRLCSDQRTNKQAVALVTAYMRCTDGSIAKNGMSISLMENVFLEQADAIDKVATIFRNRIVGLTRADAGAAIACYMSIHAEEGIDFLMKYTLGENLEAGDPAHKLRTFFLTRTSSVLPHEGYWKTIWATKMHHAGRKVAAIMADTEDWRGNMYNKLAWERARKHEKGVDTRTENRISRELAQR